MAGHCSRHLAAVTLRSVFVIGAFQPSVAFIEISSSPFSAHRFRHARTAGTVVPHYNSQRCRPVREDLRTATASMASDTGFKSSSFDWEGQWSKGLGKGDMWDTGIVSPALQDLLHTGRFVHWTTSETSITDLWQQRLKDDEEHGNRKTAWGNSVNGVYCDDEIVLCKKFVTWLWSLLRNK